MTSSFPHRKVQYDHESKSYKIFDNPDWDIEKKFQAYLDFTQVGLDENVSSEIVKVFSLMKPVYACFCPLSSDSFAAPKEKHVTSRFYFLPCPCVHCEERSLELGFDINAPYVSISLTENSIDYMIDTLKRQFENTPPYKEPLYNFVNQDEVWKDAIHRFLDEAINDSANFQIFRNMLVRYGNTTDLTWSDIIDEFNPSDLHLDMKVACWIAYHLDISKSEEEII